MCAFDSALCRFCSYDQWRRQSWGTGAGAPLWSLRMHASFAAVQTMAVFIFLPSSVTSTLDRQSHQLMWQAVAKNFSHIRFCRPNARWLSLLDDFVTTNFGTRAPRARAPWSKILATPLHVTLTLTRRPWYTNLTQIFWDIPDIPDITCLWKYLLISVKVFKS